jgi:DNA mismatch endonuclease (patch repair protein)
MEAGMDTIDPGRRSENMRQIKSRDTRPELLVRGLAHSLGYRFRLHRRDLPGSPDLVFVRLCKIIFVHGCFWHQHSKCAGGRLPRSRKAYWRAKFLRNTRRDKTVMKELRRLGWSVLVIWECETLNQSRVKRRIDRFLGRARLRRP